MLAVLSSVQPSRRVRTLDEAQNKFISGGAPQHNGAPPEIRYNKGSAGKSPKSSTHMV